MNRKLVLTNEAARHPFRQTLPPPLFAQPMRAPLNDIAFFAISLVSGFIIIFGMIV